VVVAEGVGDVGGVEERQGPGAFAEAGRLDQPGRRSPDGHEILIEILLEGRQERVEAHSEGDGRAVEAGDRGNLPPVEGGGDDAGLADRHDPPYVSGTCGILESRLPGDKRLNQPFRSIRCLIPRLSPGTRSCCWLTCCSPPSPSGRVP